MTLKRAAPQPVKNKFFVGGNWKVNGTRSSIDSLVKAWNAAGDFPDSVEVVLAPSAVHLELVRQQIRPDIQLAAQNVSTDKGYGAYTGELTAELFKDLGCGWCLAGHSERRRRKTVHKLGHDETSDSVAQKTQHALSVGLKVIVCIGETLQDRESGTTLDVCTAQLEAVRRVLKEDDWANIVIAYEPVWAIGTGVTASPEQAQEVHAALRMWLMEHVSAEVSSATRIVYGGSVKLANCRGLIAQDDIDGFLIGGASLKPSFTDIVKSVPLVWDSALRDAKRFKRMKKTQSIPLSGLSSPRSK
jgi:triosephosphate isomerase